MNNFYIAAIDNELAINDRNHILIQFIKENVKDFLSINKLSKKYFLLELINKTNFELSDILYKTLIMKNIYDISKTNYKEYIYKKTASDNQYYKENYHLYQINFKKSLIPALPFNWLELSIFKLNNIEYKWLCFREIEVFRFFINFYHNQMKEVYRNPLQKLLVPYFILNWHHDNISIEIIKNILLKFKILTDFEYERLNAILYMKNILLLNKYHVGEYTNLYFLDKWLEQDIPFLEELLSKIKIISKIENIRLKITELNIEFMENTNIQLELPRIPYNWECFSISKVENILTIFNDFLNLAIKRNKIISHLEKYFLLTIPIIPILPIDYNPKYIDFTKDLNKKVLYNVHDELTIMHNELYIISFYNKKHDISDEIQESCNWGVMELLKNKSKLLMTWQYRITHHYLDD